MSRKGKMKAKMNEEKKAQEAEVIEEKAEEKTEEKAEPEKKEEAVYEEMTLSPEEVKALKEKLDKLEADKEDAVRQAQRLQAEFENYRKRNALLSSESRDDGVRETVKALLPVLDSFERAMQSAPEDTFAEGMKNIEKQLLDALKKSGLEEVPAEGAFDPNLHEAVMKESAEGAESGSILTVFQKGYKVKGKIVRFAMVKVSE